MSKKEKIAVFIITATALIIRIILSCYEKVIVTYPDELRYLSLARSILRSHTLSIQNLATNYQKVLYSITIIPALFANGVTTQIKIIGVLNVLYLTLGVIPTYLLAKRYLSDSKFITAVCILYLFSSNFAYSVTFMSECVFLPMALFMVFLMSRQLDYLSSGSIKPVKSLLTGVYLLTLYECKEIALAFLIAIFGYEIIYFARSYYIKRKNNIIDISKKAYWNSVFLLIGFTIPFFVLKLTVFQGLGNSYNQQDTSVITDFNWYYLYYGFIYFLLMTLLAYTVFPFIITASKFRKISTSAKSLFVYLILCLVVSAATVSFTISVRENWADTIPRIHLRYICYLLIPLVILMLHSLEKAPEIGNRKKIITVSAVFLAWFCYYIIFGAIVTNYELVDQTELQMFARSSHQWIVILIYVGITALLLAVFLKNKKIAIWLILALLLGCNVTNEAITREAWYENNYISDEDADKYDALEQLVADNPNAIFAVLENYRTPYSAIDTYLETNNVVWLRIDDFQNQTIKAEGERWDKFLFENSYFDADYSLSRVDYLIWFDDIGMHGIDGILEDLGGSVISIDNEQGEYVDTSIDGLKIFKINDPDHIPEINFNLTYKTLTSDTLQ